MSLIRQIYCTCFIVLLILFATSFIPHHVLYHFQYSHSEQKQLKTLQHIFYYIQTLVYSSYGITDFFGDIIILVILYSNGDIVKLLNTKLY